MSYLGDFVEDATVIEYITSHGQSGGAIAPSSALEAADLDWYKDGSAFAPVGITMTSPFVSTGLHKVTIDTSNDGGDAWTTGADYVAILTPDETVDGETVIRVVIDFSIENRFNQTVVPSSVAEFEARTIVSADYVVVGDTIAGVTLVATTTASTDAETAIGLLHDFDPANDDVAKVTLVATTTANSDLVTAAAIKIALEADGGNLASIMEALVYKRIWREADGRLELHNAAGVSQGTIAAQVTTDGFFTIAKKALI